MTKKRSKNGEERSLKDAAKSIDVVTAAMEKVKEAVADASEGLEELGRYNDFLEELLSDAEGWKMELEERRREEEDN